MPRSLRSVCPIDASHAHRPRCGCSRTPSSARPSGGTPGDLSSFLGVARCRRCARRVVRRALRCLRRLADATRLSLSRAGAPPTQGRLRDRGGGDSCGVRRHPPALRSICRHLIWWHRGCRKPKSRAPRRSLPERGQARGRHLPKMGCAARVRCHIWVFLGGIFWSKFGT